MSGRLAVGVFATILVASIGFILFGALAGSDWSLVSIVFGVSLLATCSVFGETLFGRVKRSANASAEGEPPSAFLTPMITVWLKPLLTFSAFGIAIAGGVSGASIAPWGFGVAAVLLLVRLWLGLKYPRRGLLATKD